MIHQLGLVLLILLVVCNFGSCQLQTLNDTVTSSSNSTTVDDIDKVEREKARAKMLYNKAMAVRQEASASQEELKISVHQLYAAAGVVHLSMNYTSPAGHMMDGETFYTSDDVDITWRNGSIHHVEAVRELIYAFRSGRGAPFNPAIAHKLVKELAKIGDQEFQADLATMYSLGLEPVAPNQSNLLFILKKPNMDLAMLHYYFAAKGDDPVAKMALGFRFLHGLGVEKSCETAALYYEPVASTVISAATINGGLPSISKKRFVGVNKEARAIPTAEHEFLHYQWFADYGHADAARAVAHLLTHGPEQDLVSALDYLMQAADMGDADAMAHIGHAYANGIAVSQNNATAKAWFLKAAEKGHPSGILGLGVMHLTGQGTPVDHGLAARYLTSAADASKDWFGKSDAQFYAGLVRLHGWGTPKDLPGAMQYFEKASRGGNLLASYNLAVLYLMGTGSGVANLCESAVALLKKVSERGWASVNEASNDFENGDYGWSLYNYLKLAEIGVELAQNNAAWMLQHMYGYHGYRADDLATYMYKISAAQGNHDALVPLGDAYWYGKGIDVDLRKAGSLYTAASKINHPRALFNLGYMHQYGLGMPKDMHIAKRYYDQAMMTGTGAYLPSVLALAWLQVHNSWDAVLKPMVPKYLASFINPIFESDGLETPRATVFAKAVNALYAPFKGIVSLGNYVEAIEDAMDSTLFLWIVAFAGLVVWKMRMNRRPGIVTGQHRPTENIPDEQGNDEMAT